MLSLYPDHSETIEGTGEALRAGKTTCAEVLQKCLDRIEEWEPKVKAWVVVDREGAKEQARILDEELARGDCRGPLHGIPFGIKDIIDVKGLPTACGFEPWRDRIAAEDAECVAYLRDFGAVILGKTVTTQFAWIDPAVTRNPWNLERTPGGSSSGSAAAVATGMCLGAIGTQTGGSVIRPASFCGVVGYKLQDVWMISELMDGIHPFAPSLDQLGVFTRTLRDAILTVWLIHLPASGRKQLFSQIATIEHVDRRVLEHHGFEEIQASEVRLVRPRGFFDRRAEVETLEAFDRATRILKDAGAEIIDVNDSEIDFEGVLRDHRLIMAVEASTHHERLLREFHDDYSPHIRALVNEGLSQQATSYARVRLKMFERKRKAHEMFPNSTWVMLTPSTVGAAPDLTTTGNPCMNSPWTYFGLPTVSLPIGLSSDGMPLGIQLTAPPKHFIEDGFLPVALWCEAAIRRAASAGSDGQP